MVLLCIKCFAAFQHVHVWFHAVPNEYVCTYVLKNIVKAGIEKACSLVDM